MLYTPTTAMGAYTGPAAWPVPWTALDNPRGTIKASSQQDWRELPGPVSHNYFLFLAIVDSATCLYPNPVFRILAYGCGGKDGTILL